jgi:hypothetical protein
VLSFDNRSQYSGSNFVELGVECSWRMYLNVSRQWVKVVCSVHYPPATERRIDREVSSRLCASRQVRANSSSPLKWTGRFLVHFSGLELLAWGFIPRWSRAKLGMTAWRSLSRWHSLSDRKTEVPSSLCRSLEKYKFRHCADGLD